MYKIAVDCIAQIKTNTLAVAYNSCSLDEN